MLRMSKSILRDKSSSNSSLENLIAISQFEVITGGLSLSIKLAIESV